MRSIATSFTIMALALPVLAAEGVIDLTQLENYADQPVPAYINRDNTPGTNQLTDLGATLGRVLFYDKRLSRNDSISCSSCHQQEHAFGDLARASTGVAGVPVAAAATALIGLKVDNRPINVERGATLLDAINKAGSHVPTLCYHPEFERRAEHTSKRMT